MNTTRKTLFTVLITFMCCVSFAQKGSGFGIKGGLNYNGNGDYFASVGEAAKQPDRNVGYHIGLFGKLGNQIYFRPELIYTKTKSDYDGSDFIMSKLDAPLLLGVKVIGPLNLFAGPSFQYILDSEFDGITINNVENDFTVGLNIGAGVNLGRLGFDIRYERGFGNNEAEFINTNITSIPPSRVDTRPDQLIVSLSLKI